MSKRIQFAHGLRAGVPVVLGFLPVGIAFAIMARQAGFSILETCTMSVTVFAGASQMMAVGMHAQGAGLAAIIFTTFILNLRHVIMSTCVGKREKSELGFEGQISVSASGNFLVISAYYYKNSPRICKYLLPQNFQESSSL